MYQICQNTKYGSQTFIVDIQNNTWIPEDESNYDYQQYLAWVSEGNTPEPYEIGDDN